MFRKRFAQHGGYILKDLKPLFGLVFEDFTKEFTHWAWADQDIIWGDLQTWIEEDELRNFDIVSYSFGDNIGAYLRGQLTLFENNARNKLLWLECPLLSNVDDPLMPEGHTSLDEGCFSYQVMKHNNLRVKIVTKSTTPIDVGSLFYWIDGRLLEYRSPGVALDHLRQFEDELIAHYFKRFFPDVPPPRSSRSNLLLSTDTQVVPFIKWNRFDFKPPSELHRPQSYFPWWEETKTLVNTTQCLRWMDPQFRVCLDVRPEDEQLRNILLFNGTFFVQTFAFTHGQERAFVNLLAWKRSKDFRVTQPPANSLVKVFRISHQGIIPLICGDGACDTRP